MTIFLKGFNQILRLLYAAQWSFSLFASNEILVNYQLFSRNGLRPSRFYVLKDNIMVMASEVGVYDTDPANVALKVEDGITYIFIYLYYYN